MELHQLRCFLAVIQEGGFNRATIRLHITQPALSYQIKQLEQELGVRLFNRRPGGVTTTEVGEVLSRHALDIMEVVRGAHRAVEEVAEGVAGEVRVGTVNSVGIYFLPQLLCNMKEKYPDVCPNVLYRHSAEILESLLANRIDLALIANPGADRRLRHEVIIEERVSLVCGRSHPFFGRDAVRPGELKGLKCVSLSRENPTGKLVRDFLARMGVSMDQVASTDNVETIKKMAEIGMGVAFLPDMVSSPEVSCSGGSLGRLARIDVGSPIKRRIALLTWKNAELSRATHTFIEELRLYGSSWKSCVDANSHDQRLTTND